MSESENVPKGSFAYSTGYKYDRYGNMIQQSSVRSSFGTAPGGDGSVTRATTAIDVDPATNRLTAASYDAACNMTANNDQARPAAYTWDSIGTMRGVTEPERELHFLYTADDERLAVVSVPTLSPASKAVTTWTLRGFGNQLLRTLTEDRSTATHTWSWGGDQIWRGSSLVADVTNAGTRHFILDHLGSPRLVTDGSGTANPLPNDFSAFGSGGTTGSGPLQFTGHERDWGTDSPRSLDYMHARYYNAGVAGFLSVDPSGDSVDPEAPQSLNRYAYVKNDAIDSSDPTGMWSWTGLRDFFRIEESIAVHAYTLPEHSYDKDLAQWRQINRELDNVPRYAQATRILNRESALLGNVWDRFIAFAAPHSKLELAILIVPELKLSKVLTPSFEYAVMALKLNRTEASAALHAVKRLTRRGGANNVLFNKITGEIVSKETGEIIGNLFDHF